MGSDYVDGVSLHGILLFACIHGVCCVNGYNEINQNLNQINQIK